MCDLLRGRFPAHAHKHRAHIPTDKHNVYIGERLAIPLQKNGRNDSKSSLALSDNSTPDKQEKVNQKENRESTKTAKFLD